MTSPTPLVSIGIPTYNRAADYLVVTLESALSQDYQNLEIIIADNGSTDHTPQYIGGINDERIRYFRHEKNLNPNDNFNFCLNQAKGTYFLLLHDDDAIDPGFISACMAVAEGRTDIGVILSGTRVMGAKGEYIRENENRLEGQAPIDLIQGWFTNQTALYLCSSLYNAGLLRQAGGFNSPHNLFQDVFATYQLGLTHGWRNVRQVLASFRRHGENRGDSVKVKQWCEDSYALIEHMCLLLPEHAADIRRWGWPYMSRKNYRKAAAIQNPLQRLRTYLSVWQIFHFSESPYVPFRQNDLHRLKRNLKRFFPKN